MRSLQSLVVAGLCLLAALTTDEVAACSRVTWIGPQGQVITGRSMDWPYAFNSHLYVVPRGLAQDGAGGVNSMRWVTKYGAVVTAGSLNLGGPVDGVFDGLNEQGLAANLLYLGETDFGAVDASPRPRLSFAAWTQYLLTSYATVAEVVAAFEGDPVQIVPVSFGPGGAAHATVHMAISDASGDSAVIEYLHGRIVIHHGREYQVMTNSPTFAEQLTLNNYWKSLDGNKVLPGSLQSQDRFVRASYYLGKLPQTDDARQALAGVFSVMRNVSVPWGRPDPEHPNLAPTYWRTVIDQKNLRYYFESTLSPTIVWVDLTTIDFSAKAGLRALAVEGNDAVAGNVNRAFRKAGPIAFLGP